MVVTVGFFSSERRKKSEAVRRLLSGEQTLLCLCELDSLQVSQRLQEHLSVSIFFSCLILKGKYFLLQKKKDKHSERRIMTRKRRQGHNEAETETTMLGQICYCLGWMKGP